MKSGRQFASEKVRKREGKIPDRPLRSPRLCSVEKDVETLKQEAAAKAAQAAAEAARLTKVADEERAAKEKKQLVALGIVGFITLLAAIASWLFIGKDVS